MKVGVERGIAGSGQPTEDLQLPIRILPSGGTTRLSEGVLLIICAALALAAWAWALSVHRPVTFAEVMEVSLIFGVTLVVLAIFLIRRWQRYFGTGGRYWLAIDRGMLTLVEPDRQEAYDWSTLTRFVVEEDERITLDGQKHVEKSVTVYVAAINSGRDARALKIVADDFAANLPGNAVERAQRFCAILNDIRQWATDSAAAPRTLSRRTVSGLALASRQT